MSTEATPTGAERPVDLFVLLMQLAGTGLLLLAVLHNQFFVQWITNKAALRPEIVTGIHESQLAYAAAGALFFAAGWFISRSRLLRRNLLRGSRLNVSLGFVLTILVLFILEVSLRPYAARPVSPTTIFMPDADRGWRLRPNTTGYYMSAEITINEKGLRGPVVPYARTPGVKRILYLGDSVTFGWALPEYGAAYPYQTGFELEKGGFGPTETVNAGVDGYSPWQAYDYLADEGIRYQPDLIVYGFVLNDVTEKFSLARFGGSGVGFQLENTVFDRIDWLASRSSLIFFAIKLGQRIRFGENTASGAAAVERADVRDLIDQPDDPLVDEAWELTLANLTDIVELAAAEEVPLLLVIFPIRDQLNTPGADAPQQRLQAYAAAHGVPFFDLLPPMAEFMAERDLAPSVIYIDWYHLTVGGNELVAQLLAEPVQAALEGNRE